MKCTHCRGTGKATGNPWNGLLVSCTRCGGRGRIDESTTTPGTKEGGRDRIASEQELRELGLAAPDSAEFETEEGRLIMLVKLRQQRDKASRELLECENRRNRKLLECGNRKNRSYWLLDGAEIEEEIEKIKERLRTYDIEIQKRER